MQIRSRFRSPLTLLVMGFALIHGSRVSLCAAQNRTLSGTPDTTLPADQPDSFTPAVL